MLTAQMGENLPAMLGSWQAREDMHIVWMGVSTLQTSPTLAQDLLGWEVHSWCCAFLKCMSWAHSLQWGKHIHGRKEGWSLQSIKVAGLDPDPLPASVLGDLFPFGHVPKDVVAGPCPCSWFCDSFLGVIMQQEVKLLQRILVRAGTWPALSRLELSCRNGQNYLGLFRNNKRDTEWQNQLPTETWEWRSLRKAAFGK